MPMLDLILLRLLVVWGITAFWWMCSKCSERSSIVLLVVSVITIVVCLVVLVTKL